jgi:hypothetical protein
MSIVFSGCCYVVPCDGGVRFSGIIDIDGDRDRINCKIRVVEIKDRIFGRHERRVLFDGFKTEEWNDYPVGERFLLAFVTDPGSDAFEFQLQCEDLCGEYFQRFESDEADDSGVIDYGVINEDSFDCENK